MTATTYPQTAQELYDHAQARISAALLLLAAKVEASKAAQNLDKANWGFGGDLTHLADKLDELVAVR